VFVDIARARWAMDASQIIAKLGAKTRAVFLTHVQGSTA